MKDPIRPATVAEHAAREIERGIDDPVLAHHRAKVMAAQERFAAEAERTEEVLAHVRMHAARRPARKGKPS